jgi:hypothetical protein
MKNEVIACLLMEATTEPVKPSKLKVFNKDSLFYLRFETNLQDFNIQNRNRRIYMLEPMRESLNAPHIQELIRQKTWFGEAGHPDTDSPKRILTINPLLVSHKINSFYFSGQTLKGEVETLDDCNGPGKRMTNLILQGMEPAFSLRALAQLMKRGDGTQVVNSRAHIVGYDWVILPSHKVAYRDTSKPIEKVIQDIEVTGNSVQESVLLPVQEAQIIDFIKTESKNVKVISNVYEVAAESMTLTEDLKHVVLKENGNTYFIKIEEKIKKDITRYMSNL